jgi:hypothetical protein
MFVSSISPTKHRVKSVLLSVLLVTFLIVLLPFLLLASIGLTLITLVALKLKFPKVKRHNSRIFQAVKNKDYTVS